MADAFEGFMYDMQLMHVRNQHNEEVNQLLSVQTNLRKKLKDFAEQSNEEVARLMALVGSLMFALRVLDKDHPLLADRTLEQVMDAGAEMLKENKTATKQDIFDRSHNANAYTYDATSAGEGVLSLAVNGLIAAQGHAAALKRVVQRLDPEHPALQKEREHKARASAIAAFKKDPGSLTLFQDCAYQELQDEGYTPITEDLYNLVFTLESCWALSRQALHEAKPEHPLGKREAKDYSSLWAHAMSRNLVKVHGKPASTDEYLDALPTVVSDVLNSWKAAQAQK